ncbi:MAG: carboxypeptidase regulatory-like domain-containing protein, partial [Acidobacteria bacterium]|nr:carboxypeptidase regulatory-like domain-containing protein [Acidobacteriota bacterium]
PEIFKLPAPADEIAIGNLDEDFYRDVAVASGSQLTIIGGRGQAYPWDLIPNSGITRPAAVVAARTLPFSVAAMAVGRFGAKRGESLALLGTDGNLYRLESNLSERPANNRSNALQINGQTKNLRLPSGVETPNLAFPVEPPPPVAEGDEESFPIFEKDDVAAGKFVEFMQKKRPEAAEKFKRMSKEERDRRLAEGMRKKAEYSEKAKRGFLQSIAGRPSKLAGWSLETLAAGAPGIGAAASNAPQKMLRVNVSSGNLDDILLVDSISNQIRLVSQIKTGAQSPKAEITNLDVDGGLQAVLPLRLNRDALSDLVVLRKGATVPAAVMTAPAQVITVTSTDETGDCLGANPCSLRTAIQIANQTPGVDLIDFNVGSATIAPDSPLPVITEAVTIIGDLNGNGQPLVEISGANLTGQGVDGLKLRTSNAAVYNLTINRFPSFIDGNTGSQIGGSGITIESTIESPNHGNNIIQGNYLGTDKTGSLDEGNDAAGLNIFDADENQIGGTAPGYGNVISGNGSEQKNGVGINVTAGNDNIFQGNVIGLNSPGTGKVGNSEGVLLTGSDNIFGGDEPGAGNTVSGNGEPYPVGTQGEGLCYGVGLRTLHLFDLETGEFLTLNNDLRGNRFGTNPAGTVKLSNCQRGIQTSPWAQTSIGSITAGGRNIVSGNGWDGVWCTDYTFSEGGFCSISGNNIGTDVSGNAAIPNDWTNVPPGPITIAGIVAVANNLTYSTVGAPGGTTQYGACTGFCNLISGSASSIAALTRFGYGDVGIFNNFVGVNSGGNQALPNGMTGIFGNSNFGSTYIGLGFPGGQPMGNVVSGNDDRQIAAGGAGGSYYGGGFDAVFVHANLVGTDSTGTFSVRPAFTNISSAGVSAAAPIGSQIFIGAPWAEARNIVAGNQRDGIQTFDAGTDPGGQIQIINNLIGLNRSLAPLGNNGYGIVVTGSGTQIGGTTDQEANQIAYNGQESSRTWAGVLIDGGVGNTIRHNSIHDNNGLGIDLTPWSPFVEPDGVTPNDDCGQDADIGGNLLQNYPELFAPTVNGDGATVVDGVLKTAGLQNYTIDFYSNGQADPTEHGEGETFLGSIQVATNGNGFGSFTFTSAGPVNPSFLITATATDEYGNTSEFSCYAGAPCGNAVGFKNLAEYLAAPQDVCPAALVVNREGDQPDETPNDNVCDIDTSNTGLQCTLRAALQVVTSDTYTGLRKITFNIEGAGVHTISPVDELPPINKTIIIDATTQPGYSNTRPLIELTGAARTSPGGGLFFAAGSDGSEVRGLIINRWTSVGITFLSGHNTFENNWVGLMADGVTNDPTTQSIGIHILGANNTIGGKYPEHSNVLTGSMTQIQISGEDAASNDIQGNYFGYEGDHEFGNFSDPSTGLRIENGALKNRIGGLFLEQKNFFYGQGQSAILLIDGAHDNQLWRNQITNSIIGIRIRRAFKNFVGQPVRNEADPLYNVITNCQIGLLLGDENPPAQLAEKLRRPGADVIKEMSEWLQTHRASLAPNMTAATYENLIQGNGIGYLNDAPAPNRNQVGLMILTASQNQIGSLSSGGKAGTNVISGNFADNNGGAGVYLDTNAFQNRFYLNLIGVDALSNEARPNHIGIILRGQENLFNNNLISGNTRMGVLFDTAGDNRPDKNQFVRNKIGTARNGLTPLANGESGIVLAGEQNTITTNVLSGNNDYGIFIPPRGAGNFILNNFIGVDKTGAAPLGNGNGGLLISGPLNQITHNVISGNSRRGILFSGDSSDLIKPTQNNVRGNLIGTDSAGTFAIPNQGEGIDLSSNANQNFIGGINPGDGNVISGNDLVGIAISGIQPPALNEVKGNFIGTDKTGTLAIANTLGGIVISNSANNKIGGSGNEIPGARNIISGNNGSGIRIGGTLSANNIVSGNYIGVGSGGQPLGNTPAGIVLSNGAHNNTIGGQQPNAGNTIANNAKGGVIVLKTAGCCNNIDPNSIFANGGRGISLGCPLEVPEDQPITDLDVCSIFALPNDPDDADTGGNNLQNYPGIVSKQIANNELIVTFNVDSAPENSDYGTDGLYIEFFRADASGQGAQFLGSTRYTVADHDGAFAGTKTVNLGDINALGIGPNDPVTASATDAMGNTSEFFPPFVPTAAGVAVGGRIVDQAGRGLAGVTVTLTAGDGRTKSVRTNNFGHFRFDDVTVGETCVIAAANRKYRFEPASQVVTIDDARDDLVFTAAP